MSFHDHFENFKKLLQTTFFFSFNIKIEFFIQCVSFLLNLVVSLVAHDFKIRIFKDYCKKIRRIKKIE